MAEFSQTFIHEYEQQNIKVEESNRGCDNDVDQVVNVLMQIQEEYKSSVRKVTWKIEWSNEVTSEFLHLYEQQPAVWNPKEAVYKNCNAVAEVWKRIRRIVIKDNVFSEGVKKKKILKMQGILEKLITPDDLSGNAKRVLCETAACLQALNINDATPTNIVLQSTKMMMEESCLSRKKLQFKTKLQHQSSEKQRFTELEGNIQSAKKEEEAFREVMKGKVVETQFLQHRIEEYKNTLEKLKAEVQRLGISIHHKVIQERVEAIAQMKNECATLRQKLEKYEGLPPNLGQAQDMLAQVKQKYVRADQQLQTRLTKHTELTASLMSVP